jgi:hypothetical protein
MLNFLDVFSKNIQVSDFMKISPVGTEFFHAGGQTELKVSFFFPFSGGEGR